MTIYQEGCDAAFRWYARWAETRPNHPAVVYPDSRLSYAELHNLVAAKREILRRQGAETGGRIVLETPPGARDWLIDLLAALSLDMQVVQPDQDWARADWDRHLAPLLETRDRFPDLGGQGGIWLFTSGTTDTPKPRFRSRALLRRNVECVRARFPAGLTGDRLVMPCLLPLSHGYGITNALFLIHAAGGTVVMPEAMTPEAIAPVVERYPVRVLYAWPDHLEALADPDLWKRAAAPLSWCVSSSLRLSPERARTFRDASGCPVRQQYGTTETGPLCLDDDRVPSDSTQCVGTPLEGVALEIQDSDGNAILPPGVEGEIAVRVDGLALDRAELTERGYWRINDRGLIDRAGRVHVLGRLTPFTDERGDGDGVREGEG